MGRELCRTSKWVVKRGVQVDSGKGKSRGKGSTQEIEVRKWKRSLYTALQTMRRVPCVQRKRKGFPSLQHRRKKDGASYMQHFRERQGFLHVALQRKTGLPTCSTSEKDKASYMQHFRERQGFLHVALQRKTGLPTCSTSEEDRASYMQHFRERQGFLSVALL